MQITIPPITGNFWYLTTPGGYNIGYRDTGASPVGLTQRFSYTIPAGDAGFLNSLSLYTLRRIAATTVDYVLCYIQVTIGSNTVVLLETGFVDNTIGAGASANVSPNLYLAPGNVIAGYTQDTSVGGFVAFTMSAALSLFIP